MVCNLSSLEWHEDLKSGLAQIDKQHQHLLGLLKEMENNPSILSNSSHFAELIVEFSEAVSAHFEFEENLLEKLGYEKLEHHRGEHLEILEQLAGATLATALQKPDAKSEFIAVLCKWFKNHLHQEDKYYFPMIKKSLLGLSTD